MADAPVRPADPAAKARASKLLNDGNQQSNDGDYVEALENFRAAYQIYPSPKLLLNIGTMLRQLGKNVEAAEVYEKYLEDPEADPNQRQLLTQTLDEINNLVGHVRVTVDPADAAVSLNGTPVVIAAGGTNVRVEPGTHKIVGEKKGFPPALATISLRRGETRTIDLKLVPTPVVVQSNPLQVAGIVSLSLGALGLVGAGITGGLVVSTYEQFARDCPQEKCATAQGYQTALSGRTLLTVNAITWGVALAGGGVGTTLLLLARKKPKPSEHSILVGPGFIGWQGKF